uniref:Putative single-stranded DNA binding protein n=1 Tax=Betaphycus gelatinus TaxID=1191690 RepID=A0A8E7PH91_9FLOR|nr:putative single-stranded DNA binding protein [Betaphycus gelatinus]
MNLFIFTCRVISKPKLLRYKKQSFVYMKFSLCNDKKGIDFYNVVALAKSKVVNQIFDIYKKGDFIIVEGSIKIKSHRINAICKNYNVKKLITIKINKIHPTHHAFKLYS